MAPVFASPDIAALVAAFPPPLPTKDGPSLVRSYSGNNLSRSEKVLAEFRLLLETSQSRIRRRDLPSRLEIEQAEWVLECYEGVVHYSKDLQSLIPTLEAKAIVDAVDREARNECIRVANLGLKYDIAKQSCDQLLAAVPDLREFSRSEATERVVYSMSLVDRTKESISAAIGSSKQDKVELKIDDFMPLYILRELADEVLKEGRHTGSLEVEGEERLAYVPAEYWTLQQSQRRELYSLKLSSVINDLETDGYCEVDVSQQTEDASQDLLTDIKTRFGNKSGTAALVCFDQGAAKMGSITTVVAIKSTVEHVVKELEDIVAEVARTRRASDAAISLGALETTLCEETTYLRLTKLLLQSNEYRRILETSLGSVMRDLDNEEAQLLAKLCREALLGPLELYLQGLGTVTDSALNARLDQYVCEHFRSDVVPGLVQRAKSDGSLRDKARARYVEKLIDICKSGEAGSVQDLQSAAAKLCRKQKIELPDVAQIAEIKQRLMHQKLKDLQKMFRGSDVLQNLIWIMLARETDGLFMSSGKDTSRMVKHYQAIGATEVGQKLEHWRDLLKAGKQSDTDVQQMKAMAEEAVDSLQATHAQG